MKPDIIFNSDSGMLEVFSLLGRGGWQPASKHPQGTAVSGVGLLGNAVQQPQVSGALGNTCPREAAGETGDPKYCLPPPWFRASRSSVSNQVPFVTRWSSAKARIGSLSLVVCYLLGVSSLVPVSSQEPDLYSGVLLAHACPESAAAGHSTLHLLGSAPHSLPRLAAVTCFGWLLEFIISL